MKYIFLIAIIALGSATIQYGAQREISVDNDRIVVHSPENIIVINAPKDDEGSLVVFVKEHDRFLKKLIINKNCKIIKELSFSIQDELPEKFSEEKENEYTTTSSEEHEGVTSRCQGIQGDKTQMDFLVTKFKKYQGVVEEDRFKELLNDIKVAVDNKECHPVILEALKGFEEQTSLHTPAFHFWRFHWNTKNPMTGLRGLKYMHRDRTEDQQTTTKMFGTEHESQSNQEHGDYQSEPVQHNFKNHQEELKDTLHTTGDLFRFTRGTDCSKDAMSNQLVYQNNIQEIQGKICQHQLKAQQLQLQQQFLNHHKYNTKLQIMTGHQQGMHFTQMQELNRVCEEFYKKEVELLKTQKNLHLNILKFQQELIKQEENLQKCLEEERREEKRTMEMMV